MSAFPGLSNADIQGATPWHNHFAGTFGGLQVLVETTDGPAGRAVVIGGGAGTQITPVPEPLTLALLGVGLLGMTLSRRMKF